MIDGLKYKSPDVTMLEHARLTDEMVTLLDKYMDKARMTEAHREVWYRQYYHCETESDLDTDESSLEEQQENEIYSYFKDINTI